jgi:tol-pal system protein YbgF
MRKRLGVLALAWGVCIASAHAQVEVAEPMIPGAGPVRSAPVQQPSAPPASSVAPAAAGASSSELFYQIQLLQEEVMKLRGMVEEQAQELRQLKQQRLDDYISLDRRLAALGSAGGAPAASEATPPDAAGSAGAELRVGAGPTVAPAGEEQAYQAAYELVRARRFPEATTAFNEFVAQYPRGQFTGNAHYWLGELYLLEGDSAAAKRNFETLLNDFADNRKVPDAMFKLGRIYHQEGDTARARELLQRVVNDYGGTDSSAPRLAREYLQQNF